MRILVLALLLSVPAGPAGAQTTAPPAPTQPARDAAARKPAGTAVIRGRITAAETGRPLRRARIRITAPELEQQAPEVSTDSNGRYELTDLPAGRYTLTVNRSGYLRLRYGQRRPFEQSRLLELEEGQVLENVNLAVPRMGVIAGRVTDELGEPIEGAVVSALRSEFFEGRRRMVPAGFPTRTDDAGQYRVTSLMAGSYVLAANVRDTWRVSEKGTVVEYGYAPTYLPAVTDLLFAQRVTVGLGEQITVSDISLAPGRTARVSGAAFDSRGRPLAGGRVFISQETTGHDVGFSQGVGSASIGADGAFSFSSIPPGDYVIRATATANREPGAPAEVSRLEFSVSGEDVIGLNLTTSAGWSMSGRIRTEAGEAPPVPRAQFSFVADAASVVASPGVMTNRQIRDDWTFAIGPVIGPSRLHLTVPGGWAVKAVLIGERDVSDEPVEMKSGEELSGVEVVVTNRVAGMSGLVTDPNDQPTGDATVLVFASQPEKWFERSPWIRVVRPDEKGRYEVKDLLPANYLAVAMDYVQEGTWGDPEYLGAISRFAQTVALGDDTAPVVVPLRVVVADRSVTGP